MLELLRHRLVRHRASAWVLVAVAVRALVPDGFMFDTAPEGGLTVVFCHGAGLVVPGPAVAVHDEPPPHPAHHEDHASHAQPPGTARQADHAQHDRGTSGQGQHHAQQGQCAFAASAALAPPPAPAAATGSSLVAQTLTTEPAATSLPDERDRRPGARAPPSDS